MVDWWQILKVMLAASVGLWACIKIFVYILMIREDREER